MIEKVNWSLPGMEDLSKDDISWITRLIEGGDLVTDISCLGWAYWPTQNKGFLDERLLRTLANFIEIQNKPLWDGYDEYCEQNEELKTPEEWLKTDEYRQYTIMDPDGWRGKDAPSWGTPLTHKEFEHRLMQCTLMRGLNGS